MLTTCRPLDRPEERLLARRAALAGVAGDVGVGDTEFRAARSDLAPEFFERDRFSLWRSSTPYSPAVS
jgi:hypothetical protein